MLFKARNHCKTRSTPATLIKLWTQQKEKHWLTMTTIVFSTKGQLDLETKTNQ